MTATPGPADSGTSATVASAINDELFDQLTHELGADDESARARLVDVDRVTLYRWRRGTYAPRLDVASRIAKALGTTVDKLFPGVAP